MKLAQRELTKQRRRYRARRIILEVQEVKNKHIVCHELHCEEEDAVTSVRQKWKKELERYSRMKYQDDEMKKMARRELEEWEGRRKKSYNWACQEPRLTMSVLMQSRATFSNGKAVGIDGLSAEILNSIPWRALQKFRRTFELRYQGLNREEIETWLRNIIVLIPKKRIINKLEGQTRGICVQSVVATWYCG